MVICIASYCFVNANSRIRQTLIAIAVGCAYLTKEMQLFNTEFGVLNAEHGAFEHLYFNSPLCMVCDQNEAITNMASMDTRDYEN